MKNYYI